MRSSRLGVCSDVREPADLEGFLDDRRQLQAKQDEAILEATCQAPCLPVVSDLWLRSDLDRKGIRVVDVRPGYVDTDMNAAQVWKDTMLDVHGDLVEQLKLESGSDKPFVYVLDKKGRVTAAVRGALDNRTRPVVWSALRR
jgi:hypothetical protein